MKRIIATALLASLLGCYEPHITKDEYTESVSCRMKDARKKAGQKSDNINWYCERKIEWEFKKQPTENTSSKHK